DLSGALAGKEQQSVRGIVALDVELDLVADFRRLPLELLERKHSLRTTAGHLDEHVLAMHADDAALLAGSRDRRGAGGLGLLSGLCLVDRRFGREALHRGVQLVLDRLVEFAVVRLEGAELLAVELRRRTAGVGRAIALRKGSVTAAGPRTTGSRA